MGPNRWRRFSDWDERPLRLDKFAVEDAENGFAAFNSPHDPKPALAIEGGRVVMLDRPSSASAACLGCELTPVVDKVLNLESTAP